ncbi:MAG: CcoQ/FixQ family Cbb3-type cytochrome c oxidase assembly chaperone [Saprospiraceae bacterium]
MKFSNYLQSIDHVSIYPLISLVLFLSVFIGVVIYMFKMEKELLDEKSNIPLK